MTTPRIHRTDFYGNEPSYVALMQAWAYHDAARLARRYRGSKFLQTLLRDAMRTHARLAVGATRRAVAIKAELNAKYPISANLQHPAA
jgi:hypothetical protein